MTESRLWVLKDNIIILCALAVTMSLGGGKIFLFSPLEMFPKIMAIQKGVSTLGLSTGEGRDALEDELGLST